MATNVENFLINIATRGGQSLTSLGNNVVDVSNKVSGLNTLLAAVGFGAFIKNAMASADALVDLSKATGISVVNIKAMETALELAGGKANDTGKVINTLYASIETANDGSKKLQSAFGDVGVSLGMLKDASEQEILDKAIKGLSTMEEGSARTNLAVQIFGRSMRSVDPKDFANRLEEMKEEFKGNEAAILAVANAQGMLDDSMKAFTDAAIINIGKVVGLFGDTGLSAKQADTAVKIVGATVALLFSAKAIASAAAFVKLMKEWQVITKGQVILQTALTALQGPKGWATMAAGAAAAGVSIYALNELLDDTEEKGKKAIDSVQPPLATNTKPANRSQTQAVDPTRKALEESKSRIAVYEAERDKFNQLAAVGGNQIAQMEINKAFEIKQARAEIKAKEHLSDAQKSKETAEKIASINAKYAKDETEYRRDLYIKLYQDQVATAEENAKLIAEQETSYQQAAAAAQGIATEYGKQITLMGDRITLENGLLSLSTEDADLKRKLFDLEQGRLAKVEEINKQVQDGKLAYADSLISIQKINDANVKGIDILKQQAEITKQRQNDPIAALRDSLKKFGEDNTPFKQTQKEVEVLFNGMNSAIDNFVETGKFKFGDFASSVIKDLIKIELKAQATTLLRTFIGSFIPGGGIGARAEGGPVSANTPYLVGERGPELFMPKGNGNIVPNDALGGGGGGVSNTAITYNIQAVDASSFRSLVASDPEFMYAVTEQGRRRQPSRRRV